MPAISIDTFFACSLMVLLVLSAMAGTSKLLYPQLNNAGNENIAKRYKEISTYILLSAGTPSNWGENDKSIPETFGLAKADSDSPYELDIDKVSRLNTENRFALSYAQMFTILEMPDVSFGIEIKPVFDVAINHTATYAGTGETTYEFAIATERHGVSVPAELKYYVVAGDYLGTYSVYSSNGEASLNVTLSNTVDGPALLMVIARTTSNTKLMSFNACAFAHNSAEPKSTGTFLNLSPLNHVLNVSYNYPGLNLAKAYALTFDYSSSLTEAIHNNQSATYDIPHFSDSSPAMIVVAGRNSTTSFVEWTAYPQVPLQAGANFASSETLSDVFTYTYAVTLNSVIYECTVWVGGPKQ